MIDSIKLKQVSVLLVVIMVILLQIATRYIKHAVNPLMLQSKNHSLLKLIPLWKWLVWSWRTGTRTPEPHTYPTERLRRPNRLHEESATCSCLPTISNKSDRLCQMVKSRSLSFPQFNEINGPFDLTSSIFGALCLFLQAWILLLSLLSMDILETPPYSRDWCYFSQQSNAFACYYMNNPFQLLYNQTPETFRRAWYPHLHPYNAVSSTKCIFLSNNTKLKGYFCLNSSNSKLYTCHSVVFYETSFL